MEHGCFVIRNEGDGCLTCKYMHDKKGPFTEACRLKKGQKQDENDPFCSVFESTWLEDGNKKGDATLEIKRQAQNPLLFDFRWHDGSRDIFSGAGMLHNGLLIGTYWEVPKKKTS